MSATRALIAVALLAGCSSSEGGADAGAASPSANGRRGEGVTLTDAERASIEIDTVEVRRRTTTRSVTLPGRIEARPEGDAVAASLLPGRVVRLYAAIGDAVRRGEALARIAAPDLAERVRELRAAYDEVLRQRELAARGAAVDKDRLAAERRWTATRQGFEALGFSERRTRRAARGERDLTAYTVRAPISGRVVARYVKLGAPVHAGEAAMRVLEVDRLRVVAHAFERDLADLAPGQRAFVTTALADGAHETRIARINPVVEGRRRAAKVVALLGAAGALRPGAYARVRVLVEGEEAPAVPASALLTDDEGAYVVVAEEGGRYVRRRVEADPSQGGVVAVPELPVGTRVVTKGAFLLASEMEQES